MWPESKDIVTFYIIFYQIKVNPDYQKLAVHTNYESINVIATCYKFRKRPFII
jgi:hypothetical protein